MKKILLFILIILSIYSCDRKPYKSARELAKIKKDSLVNAKIKSDSISLLNIKINKVLKIGDISLIVVSPFKLAKKVSFEHEESYYRYQESERFQSFINGTIIISSKTKAKDPTKFFPNFNIFSIDKNNKANFIGELTLNTLLKTKRNIAYLEQIFDYQESETFIAWEAVDVPFKDKIVISVAPSEDKSFNVNNIIAVFNP